MILYKEMLCQCSEIGELTLDTLLWRKLLCYLASFIHRCNQTRKTRQFKMNSASGYSWCVKWMSKSGIPCPTLDHIKSVDLVEFYGPTTSQINLSKCCLYLVTDRVDPFSLWNRYKKCKTRHYMAEGRNESWRHICVWKGVFCAHEV